MSELPRIIERVRLGRACAVCGDLSTHKLTIEFERENLLAQTDRAKSLSSPVEAYACARHYDDPPMAFLDGIMFRQRGDWQEGLKGDI